ncbi:MAG: hypothetical protein WC980_10750 [Candidatus Brocadiia bacterium]
MTKPTPKLTPTDIEAIKERARIAGQDKALRAMILARETSESFTKSWYDIRLNFQDFLKN